jgi:hypothetical protein
MFFNVLYIIVWYNLYYRGGIAAMLLLLLSSIISARVAMFFNMKPELDSL